MANFACGGISLAWEYAFDGASVGNPLHTYRISGIKTSPSGAIAIEISNGSSDVPRERRVVLLNKDGTQQWISANLWPELDEGAIIRFLHVSGDSFIFRSGVGGGEGDWEEAAGPSTVYMYHSKATPVFTSTILEGEAVAAPEDIDEESFSLINTPTSFFSL